MPSIERPRVVVSLALGFVLFAGCEQKGSMDATK